MNIRRYEPGEEETIWALYHDTTHIVNGADYTPEQCERWAPSACNMDEWKARLKETAPIVAEQDGAIVGFAELDASGEIGFFYCRHDWQRKGVGKALFEAIEAEAGSADLYEMRAAVSTSAKSFFVAMGFEVVREQTKVICGADAKNYVMRKILSRDAGTGGVPCK